MKRHFSIFVLAGCGAILMFGIVRLVELRFAQGEVYPEYSSLRAVPLGTMVFYESLESMPGISARRDFSDLNRLPEEPQTAYLHLASPRYEWESMPADLFHELQNFLARGNRLVITFFPQTGPHVFHQYRGDDETNSVKSAKGKDEKMPEAKPAKSRKKPTADEPDISLEDKWEFHIGFEKLPVDGETYAPVRARNRTDLPLPQTLEWHSGLVLTNCGSRWRTIYARGTNGSPPRKLTRRPSVRSPVEPKPTARWLPPACCTSINSVMPRVRCRFSLRRFALARAGRYPKKRVGASSRRIARWWIQRPSWPRCGSSWRSIRRVF